LALSHPVGALLAAVWVITPGGAASVAASLTGPKSDATITLLPAPVPPICIPPGKIVVPPAEAPPPKDIPLLPKDDPPEDIDLPGGMLMLPSHVVVGMVAVIVLLVSPILLLVSPILLLSSPILLLPISSFEPPDTDRILISEPLAPGTLAAVSG